MNEAETRAELIDPQLRASGWGVLEGSKILRERHITKGKIQTGGRGKPLITDNILVHKNRQLAVVEAKSDELGVGEGVAQAKNYAGRERAWSRRRASRFGRCQRWRVCEKFLSHARRVQL